MKMRLIHENDYENLLYKFLEIASFQTHIIQIFLAILYKFLEIASFQTHGLQQEIRVTASYENIANIASYSWRKFNRILQAEWSNKTPQNNNKLSPWEDIRSIFSRVYREDQSFLIIPLRRYT